MNDLGVGAKIDIEIKEETKGSSGKEIDSKEMIGEDEISTIKSKQNVMVGDSDSIVLQKVTKATSQMTQKKCRSSPR